MINLKDWQQLVWRTLVGAAVLLMAGSPQTARSADNNRPPRAVTQGALADLAFETSPFMQKTAYRNVAKMNRDAAPSGAYSPVNIAWEASNKQGKWYIEQQRYGGDLVNGGLAVQDTDAIDRGLRIFAWGWAQQQPDGSFDCPDPFHSTSFFVEAVAHSLLLLQASGYKERYAAVIADTKPKLLKAAQWMIRPEPEAKGKRHNARYTHRYYLVACALGQAGVLCGDPVLVKKSEEYIREGIALQHASGYNPEKGGHDSSYNAVGLFLAERYYVLVASDALRPALYAMLEKGIAWQKSRTNKDGTINIDGNTRVGNTQETGRNGTVKKVAVSQIYRTFGYWAWLSGDATYEDLAVQVAVVSRAPKPPEPASLGVNVPSRLQKPG